MIKYICDACGKDMKESEVNEVHIPTVSLNVGLVDYDGVNIEYLPKDTENHEICDSCNIKGWNHYCSALGLNDMPIESKPKEKPTQWHKYNIGNDVEDTGYLVKYRATGSADLMFQIMKHKDGLWIDGVGLVIDNEAVGEYIKLEDLL